MEQKGNSDLWRRIRLYGFGFLIGLLACYFMFGGRGCKSLTPGMLELDYLLKNTKLQYSDTALCEMKCQQISDSAVREAFTYGKIDSKKSQDFHQRHPLFNFNGQTRNGRKLNVIAMQFDSVTRVIYVKDSAKRDSCKCP